MMRPPFTLLIVKDGHDPVTVRCSTRVMVTLIVVAVAIAGAIGTGGFWWGHMHDIPGRLDVIPQPDRETEARVRETLPDAVVADIPGPDIADIAVSGAADDATGVSLRVTGADGYPLLYVWIVLDPGDRNPESAVYPQNPMFRGFPVDYRNGIRLVPAISDRIEAVIPVTAIDHFRVIVYGPEGSLITDRRYTVTATDTSPGT